MSSVQSGFQGHEAKHRFAGAVTARERQEGGLMHMQPGHRITERSIYTYSKQSVVAALTIAPLAAPISAGWAQGNPAHDQIHSATPTQFGIGAASVLLSIPY